MYILVSVHVYRNMRKLNCGEVSHHPVQLAFKSLHDTCTLYIPCPSMYIPLSLFICVCTHTQLSLSLSVYFCLSLSFYIYIYIYMYIYTYIHSMWRYPLASVFGAVIKCLTRNCGHKMSHSQFAFAKQSKSFLRMESENLKQKKRKTSEPFPAGLHRSPNIGRYGVDTG